MPPHEDLVQSLRNHVNQQVYNPPIIPTTENFMPNLSFPSSSTSYSAVVQMNNDDGYASDSSFHTAPGSPSRLMDVDENIPPPSNKTYDDLQREFDDLKLQQQKNEQERERINLELKIKKEQNDTINLRLLELNVRMSIKKNKKKTKPVKLEQELERETKLLEITSNHIQDYSVPAPTKRKKRPAPPPRRRSPSPSPPPRPLQLRYANIENTHGRLNSQYSQYLASEDRARANGEYEEPPKPPKPPKPVDHTATLKKIVRQSHVQGFVSLGQMRHQLINLHEQPILSVPQIANARELTKRICHHWLLEEDYIPTRPDYKNARKSRIEPSRELMLPREFYGNVNTLDYDKEPETKEMLARAVHRFIHMGLYTKYQLNPEIKVIYRLLSLF